MYLMRTIANLAGLFCLISIGCGDRAGTGPVAANPYDVSNQRAAVSGPAPRQPNRATSASPAGAAQSGPRAAVVATSQHTQGMSSRPRTGTTSTPRPTTISMRRPPGRNSGAHAVQLSMSEYSRMARRAADMLNELAEIHIAVDESGDAAPHQKRWGELTADLTGLHREVLASGYPPADVAANLQKSWLPSLDEAITTAARAVQEHTSVESGFEYCLQEAEAIREHLRQTRDDAASP